MSSNEYDLITTIGIKWVYKLSTCKSSYLIGTRMSHILRITRLQPKHKSGCEVIKKYINSVIKSKSQFYGLRIHPRSQMRFIEWSKHTIWNKIKMFIYAKQSIICTFNKYGHINT